MHFFGSGNIFRSGPAGRIFGRRTFTNYLKQIVRTPHGFCCAAGLGNFASDGKFAGSIFLVRGYGARFIAEQNFASDEKFATSIFGSGATGQNFSRSKILQAMKSLPQVFFGPGLRGEVFGGEKFCKR